MSRFVIFPLQDKEVWKSYKDQENSFWTVEEVTLEKDIYDWQTKLNDNERDYLKHVLAFFAASDGIVAKNVDINFIHQVDKRGWMEAKFAYQYQIMMENIHNEAYSKMIETLISDMEERNRLFNAVETVPSVKRKAEWALRWMGTDDVKFNDLPEAVKSNMQWQRDEGITSNDELFDYMDQKHPSFAQQLVAFAAVEGIFFSASFCAIYWLKFRGTADPKNDGSLLPGVCKFNELISRDEGMHQSFATLMYKREIERDPRQALDESEIKKIIGEAVEYEKQFATESLPVNLLGMNGESMCKHIEVCADRLLGQLGCSKMYNSTEPFSWMDLISMNRKTNFFEERPTEYAKAGSGTTADDPSNAIKFDADF
jgi:ribonucleoside-diphosphate reductase beta chain